MDKLIKEYSKKLTKELGKEYTPINLKYYRQFYTFSNSHTVCDELSWSHYRTLLSIHNENKIEYYINTAIKYNLDIRKIKEYKSKEYK